LLEALRWSISVLVQAFLHRGRVFTKQGLCLTHGDALTGLYGAILAKMGSCAIGHVEAGERTHNWRKPFPEEIIRAIIDRWSDLSFTMSDSSYRLLVDKGIGGTVVNVHENSLYDAVKIALNQSIRLGLPEPYALVSIHRFETILSRERMSIIVETLEKITARMNIVFGLHQPTHDQLIKYELLHRLERNERVHLQPLFDYFSFIHAMHGCEFLVTDGGGPQEESFYLGVPCLLLRTETERGFHPNVFVSEFDSEKISHFVETFEAYKGNGVTLENSPSISIVDGIEDWQHRLDR
jgi:UDP-N-acetylglucosamine 2-epimerase (non-hydrolysing)